MRIAVVGGKGFIGTEFIKYTEGRDHEIVIIECDLDAFSEDGEKAIKNILKDCDAMVFLAAKRPIGDFTMSEYMFNVSLAEKYLGFAQETGIDNVVLTSSRSVYSSDELPWREDDFQTPLSLYGAAKQAVDSLALLYNAEYGMKIKSLRLAQVIGMGEHKGFLLNTLIDNAIAKRKQSIFGKGIGRRQYIYVKDVCDAILHSITAEKENAGIFNIGMKDNVSIIELAETVNSVFGNEAGMEILEDKPEDTKEYLMDVSKTERELHWTPRFDLKGTFVDIRDN